MVGAVDRRNGVGVAWGQLVLCVRQLEIDRWFDKYSITVQLVLCVMTAGDRQMVDKYSIIFRVYLNSW